MKDVLIRDVPDAVLAALTANARRLGVSRTEYLRRLLVQDAERADRRVTGEDLRRFATTFADLADPDVVSAAWD
ncbi:antitoxin [uncultured Jatrophihabitans sp.]|uniref:type II toxin-antitoxin system VapB family antitoxin n=1 Tax=uncultured Jatrophihabitans sp. TaxID=1610747 RepID=UPI0035C9819F